MVAPFRSGQHQLAFVSSAREGVRKFLVRVGAAATRALKYAGAASNLVVGLLEVRTLLKAAIHLVPTLKVESAGAAALPAPLGHVLELSHAVLCVFRCGGSVGDADASANIVDPLVCFFRLRFGPLVGYAGESARIAYGLARTCRSTAKNKSAAGTARNRLLSFIATSFVLEKDFIEGAVTDPRASAVFS